MGKIGKYLTENLINLTNDKQIGYTFENESWELYNFCQYTYNDCTVENGKANGTTVYFFNVKRPTSDGKEQ